MVGAAMQQGYIERVDQPMSDFFPDLAEAGSEQGAITLEDMLTMRSGLRCLDETDTTVTAMQRTDDWIGLPPSRPMSPSMIREVLWRIRRTLRPNKPR